MQSVCMSKLNIVLKMANLCFQVRLRSSRAGMCECRVSWFEVAASLVMVNEIHDKFRENRVPDDPEFVD